MPQLKVGSVLGLSISRCDSLGWLLSVDEETEDEADQADYEVEAILGKKVIKGILHYRVKWKSIVHSFVLGYIRDGLRVLIHCALCVGETGRLPRVCSILGAKT